MGVGNKAVSKRSARLYVEDEMGKEAPEYQSKRLSKELGPDDSSRATSTAKSTHQCNQTTTELSTVGSVTTPEYSVGDMLSGMEQEVIEGFTGVVENPRSKDLVQAYPIYCNGTTYEKISLAGRPANFGIVVPGVYRSSFPQTEDYSFIENLKLKTIVTLVQKDFPQGYEAFIRKNGIRHHVFDMKGTKKEEIPIKTMKAILRLVLDQQNHPLLIHCNHGKHRTGCVVGVVRKVSGWDVSSIVDEYKSYAQPKIRECDIKYITGFQLSSLSNLWVKDATNWPFQFCNFFRITLFTLVVLVIWFFTGTKISAPKRKLLK
ncbi:tyrosine phosphatase family-domain-containing protein [Diplogelasinospora grovesii]|uniref:diphosphoinositol-polyphosphate diphosphatase n=1 Tax=Diplogelasinospora grovesii TaxID=303347 RepID=A0AAN6N1I8_9PEZI|nr:tyrosine phosphatase family-domain-containing protein [Diplogelasinospora grovesii]